MCRVPEILNKCTCVFGQTVMTKKYNYINYISELLLHYLSIYMFCCFILFHLGEKN